MKEITEIITVQITNIVSDITDEDIDHAVIISKDQSWRTDIAKAIKDVLGVDNVIVSDCQIFAMDQ